MNELELKARIQEAIQLQGRGAHVRISKVVGVSSATLSQMLNGVRPLPLARAIEVLQALNLELTLQPRK